MSVSEAGDHGLSAWQRWCVLCVCVCVCVCVRCFVLLVIQVLV